MSDIFISYASDDGKRIMPLVRALKKTRWSVFWDRTIPTGKHWRKVLGKEIKDCRAIIVVWSKTSVESDYVQEEAEEGKQRGILFPVLIDDISPPFGFKGLQAQNLTGWEGTVPHPAYDKLVNDIRMLLGAPPGRMEKEQKQKEAKAKHKAAEDKRKADAERKIQEEERQRQDSKTQLKKMDIRFSEVAFLNSVEDGETKAVKLFLKAGMNHDTKDKDGNSATILAADSGRTEIMKALIAAGADVNAKNRDGDSAIILAANKDIKNLLKEAGAKE